MEWLKAILRNSEIKDGKLDMEAVMKAVNTAFPKHAVPKQVYNNKVKELRTANTAIADLKKNSAENKELRTKIKDYEIEIKNLKEAAVNTRKEYALKNKLKESGVLDAGYIIYKYGGLDQFTFDNEGIPVDIDDVLNPIRESFPYLFKTEGGGDSAKENDLPKTDLTLGKGETCSVIIQCMPRN
ncbi:MAG: phage scaffolding protein [Lacrimispora sp.]|uniref:phage scaffolding protein n=1 Tax=Lacrimispora sp. TaxID=2719234 RepID=UPI0039E39292